jgi:hypothetical protein
LKLYLTDSVTVENGIELFVIDDTMKKYKDSLAEEYWKIIEEKLKQKILAKDNSKDFSQS